MSDVNQEKSYRTGCPVLDRGCCSCRETYGGAFPAVERTGVGIELADRVYSVLRIRSSCLASGIDALSHPPTWCSTHQRGVLSLPLTAMFLCTDPCTARAHIKVCPGPSKLPPAQEPRGTVRREGRSKNSPVHKHRPGDTQSPSMLVDGEGFGSYLWACISHIVAMEGGHSSDSCSSAFRSFASSVDSRSMPS